ncbi:MAG: autotransporter-associated beta strand repeat-containing protein, partial [Gemmataceae bacterium]
MFFSWWRKLSALRSKFFTALDRQPLHRRRSTLRLQMETLEERLAPAVRIWSGAGADAFWSNPQNWVGNVAPTAGDDLIFGAAAQTVSTNDLAAGTVFNSIQFTTDGYNVTGNAIQLNGSIAATHTSGDNIFNIDVTLLNATTFVVGNAGATLTFSGNVDTAGLVGHTGILGTSSFIVDGAGVLHISGVVSGSSGIFKQGPGTLILSGANTYEGITEVRQGVITVRHDMALGAVTGHTLVAVGAALNIEGDGLSINEPLAINDGGVGFGDNTSSEGLGALRNLSGTNTWTGGIELVAANNIIGVDTGSTLIVSGVIGSSQLTQRNLYKAGGGTLQFAGTQANTYHGDTTVLQGTLELNKRANPADPSTGFAAFTRNLTIGTHFGGDDDAVVRLLADNQIPHADRFGTTFLTVTINSSGLLDLNNFDTAIGNLNLFVGSTFSADVATGSGTLFLMGNVLVTGFQGSSGASPAATISGNLHLADAFSGGTTALVNRTFTVNDTQLANIAADLHISANITGSAAVDFVKLGTGTLRLSGSNTFAGPLLHSAGLIEVEGNSALGTGLVSIQGTGYLSAVGSSVLITNPISLDGTLSTYGDHDFEFSGPATLSANRVIQVMNANQTVVFSGGIVQGPFATANLTKQGRGTLVISGASTYSGTTVIDNDGGTLILRDQGTILNSSAITVGINASLILDNSVPGGNLSDRLHDQAPITLNGRLVFVGAEGEASSEQVGFVTTLDQGIGVFESQVSTTPGSSSHLIVGGLTGGSANRTVIFVGTGADLSHDGPNRISFIRTPVAPQNGIISTAVVRGASGETTFGTYASVPEGIGIIPLPASGYHNDINTALAIHNVRLAAGVHTLNQSMTINSLILEDGAILNLADGATLFINQTSNLILGNGSEINGPGVLVLGNLNTTAAAASATIHVPEGAIATINAETFGATSALTKSGRGTLVLTGDNKFGGVFNINEGVVNIQHSRALGTTATAVNVRHGASLELEESTNGPINVGVRTLNLQGTGFNDTGVLRNVAGNNSWAGNVGQAGNAFDVSALVGGFAGTTGAILSPINRTAVFYDVAAGTTLTLSGVVSGNIDLIKRGEGTLEFAGTSANTVNAVVRILEGELLFNKVPGLNSVAGGTIVIGDGLGGDNADVLRLGGGDQIPDGVRIYVMSSGLFDLNGHGDAVGQLLLEIGPTAAGDINIGTGGILTITTNPIVLSQGSGNPIGATISGGTFALQLFGTVTTPGTRTFNVNDGAVGSDLIISSAIVDGTGLQSVGIIKTGFGSLELTGLEDNTFSGTTTVQEGELLLNKGNGSGNVLALMGPLTIGDNTITSGYGRSDVVRLLQSEQLPDFLALITIQSTGLLDLNGFDETIGTTFIQNALVLNTGVVETGGGTLTINGNIATTSAQTPTGFAVVVNPAQINGGNLHLNAPVTDIAVAAHAGLTIDAIISANISGDTTIRKLTGGSGLLLSGNNSYGGDTYLTAGTLAVGSNTPVGLGMLFASSNTLIYAVDGPRTLSNNVQLGGGATTHTLGYWNNLNLAGPVTLYSGTTTVNVSTAVTVEFSGGVGNKVGAVNLAKAGYGRLVLSDGTAHGGTTVVNTNGGHLIVSGQGRILNTTSYTVNVGGHLVIDNDSGGNLPDRIEDTIPITLTGGTLAFVGASGADSSERVGVVTLSANFGSTIQVLGDGSFDSILTIASLTRGGASTVNFMGRGVDLGPTSTNQVVFNLMPLRTGPAGSEILPYAVVTSASGQVDAATHQGHGTSIQAFTNYSTGDINNAPAGSVYLLDSNQTLTSNLSLNGIVVRGNGVTLSGDPGVAVTLTGGAIINGGATLALPNVIAVPDIILANEGIVQTYGTLDIQSAIGQSGARALTLAGSGRTIASGTGVNTYSGATVINSGIYRAAKDTAFGTTAGNVIVSYGATVELDGGITVPAETITLNGSGEGITSNIPLRNISGENTWQGNVVLAANRTGIAVDAGRLIINGVVSGASIGFNKFGEGILQFGGGGNNSNSGTNFIWQGTVELNKTPGLNALAAATIVGDHVGGNNADALVLLADDQIPNVTITINSSGLFDLNGNSETFTATATAALTAINMHTGPAASAELRIGSGTLTLDNTSFAKNITVTTTIVGGSSPPALITGTTGSLNIINGTSTITVNDSDSLDDLIISAIISGDGNFTKAGNGRMVLSGDNSFTGNVTVAAGELALRHANALGAPGGTNSVTAGAAVILQNVNVSGETLTLNGNGPGNSGALRNDIGDNEWSGDIILNTASRVGVEAGTTLTLSGSIQGGGGLIKELPGTLIYSGAVANTYIGNTTIQEGTLILNKSVANGAIAAGTLIIGNNAGGPGADVVQIGLGAGTPQQIAAGVAVTINTSGLLDLNGNNMAIGGLTTITAGPTFSGSIALSGATLTLNGDVTVNVMGTMTSAAPGAEIGGGTLAFSAARTFTVNNNALHLRELVISANILSSANLLKAGAGDLLLTADNSSFSGNVQLGGGTLAVGHDNALGTGALNVTAAAVILADGGSRTIANNVNLSAALTVRGDQDFTFGGTIAQTVAAGALTTNQAGGTSIIFANSIILLNASTLLITTSTFRAITEVSGVISDGAGTGGIVKAGTGVLILSNANTYKGVTQVNAGGGILRVTHGDALGSTTGTTTVNTNAALELLGSFTIAENLSFQGANARGVPGLEDGALRVVGSSSDVTWAGTITLGTGNGQFNAIGVDAGSRLIVSGEIGQLVSNVGLIKVGDGTLQLASPTGNTFAGGLIVRQGTLELNVGAGNSFAGNLTIGDHGGGANSDRVVLLASDQIPTVTVTLMASGQLDLSANGGQFDLISLFAMQRIWNVAPSIVTGAGTLQINTTSTMISATGYFTDGTTPAGTIEGNLNLGGAGRTITVNDTFVASDAEDLVISAVIGQTAAAGVTKSGNGTLALLGSNTFTGTTTVNAAFNTSARGFTGSLVLRGGGTLNNATGGAVTVNSGATLVLDNSAGSVDRIRDTSTVTLAGGMLDFIAHEDGTTEQIGTLTINAGNNTANSVIRSTKTGDGDAQFIATSLTRGAGGLVHFIGVGADLGELAVTGNEIRINGGTNPFVNGVLPYGTIEGPSSSLDLVRDADGVVSAPYIIGRVVSYATDINTPNGIVRLDGTEPAANRILTGNVTIAALLIDGNNVVISEDVAGRTLTINPGAQSGLVVNRGTGNEITVSTLAFAARDPIFNIVSGDMGVSAAITGTAAMRKEGSGELIFTGNNIGFTNSITINNGVLRVGHNNALGTATNVAGTSTIVNSLAQLVLDASLATGGTLTIGNELLNVANGLAIADNGRRGAVVAVGGVTTWGTGTTSITLNAGLTVIDVHADSELVWAGTLNNNITTASLLKIGGGVLELAGTASNITNTGPFFINEGTVRLNKTGDGINAMRMNVVIGDFSGTDVLEYGPTAGNDQIQDATARTVQVTPSGVWNLNNINDRIAGAVTMTGGTITTGSGTLILANNLTVTTSAAPATISGNLDLAAGTRTFTVNDAAGDIGLTISANVSNGTFAKAGTGTLLFSGARTHTGTVNLSAGTLALDDPGALGTATLNVTANSTLRGEGIDLVGANAITNNVNRT